MIYTRFDKITFILRTLALVAIFILAYFWMQEASGVNGYAITEVQPDRVIVNCGVMRAAIQLESTEGLEAGMRIPAYPEIVAIAQNTYYLLAAVLAIMTVWHVCIFVKVEQRIQRNRCKKRGLKQPGVITKYNHIVGNLYTPVVDEKFHPKVTMTKGDIKTYPINTKCIIYHLGPKESWVDILKEKAE